MIPLGKYIKIQISIDFGLQQFNKEKKYQLLVKILESDFNFQHEFVQLILSYKQRRAIAAVKEKKNLDGIILKIIKKVASAWYRKSYTYLYFYDVEKPQQKQTTLLNVADCSKVPGE